MNKKNYRKPKIQDVIDRNLCIACVKCMKACPEYAINFELKEGYYKPQIDYTKCTGCLICDSNCDAIGLLETISLEGPPRCIIYCFL